MEQGAFRVTAGHSPGIHAVVARSAHSFALHTHDDFGIGVITAGAQRWHSGRAQVEAGPGSAIAVNPGEVHDGAPIGDHGRAWQMVYISPHLFQAAADDVFTGTSGDFELATPVITNPRVVDLVVDLFASEAGPVPNPMRSEELLIGLAAEAGHRIVKRDQTPPANIAKAKQRVDDDPSSSLTLASLAELSGVSRFQLLRSFVRSTGFTPHAYVVQRRVDLARRLIARGGQLAEVAAASGFADQSHMTRTFVRKYGLPPGSYARALR